MDRRLRETMAQAMGTSRSRRQVLGTAAKGTIGSVGAALIGTGISQAPRGFGLAPAAYAQGAAVSIVDFDYVPPMLEIPIGAEVTWTNNGGAPHTVTANDGSFDSGTLISGQTFARTFAAAGEVPYFCTIHGQEMAGMIAVVEGASPPPAMRVRRNLHTLTPDSPDLKAYAKAVGKMRELPLTDPTSWLYQAYIHGMPEEAQEDLLEELGDPTLAEIAAALGERGWFTCEHHMDVETAPIEPYFLPWHRMYLYWFEQIIGKLGDYPEFALPYWDYLNPDQRVLPEPFRTDGNPLFEAERDPALNRGDVPTLTPQQENEVFNSVCAGFALNDFLLAADGLETTPHDFVHGWVGGFYSGVEGKMSSVLTSAQDPLFWLHHANLDRLWESWRSLGGLNPTTDETWMKNDVNRDLLAPETIPYAFFDKDGVKVETVRIVHQVLDTEALGYTYDALFSSADPACRPSPMATPGPEAAAFATPSATQGSRVELARSEESDRIAVSSDPVEIPVTLEAPQEAAGMVEQGDSILLLLEGIRGEGVTGAVFEVYINLPPGEAPDFRSRYYVGNISLFGVQPWDAGAIRGHHTASRLFDISRNVAELQATNEWTGSATVTIVPYRDVAAPPEAAGATPAALPAGPWITLDAVSISTR